MQELILEKQKEKMICEICGSEFRRHGKSEHYKTLKHLNACGLLSIDSDDENNALNKIIANRQYGLLEKSQNNKSKGFDFDTIEECNHYRIKYGGKVNYRGEFLK